MSSEGMAGGAHREASGEQHPLFSLPLREGVLYLWPDRILLGSTSFPLTELIQAALVPYPAGAPGAIAYGLLVRMRDGRAPLLIPEDTAATQHFLDALYAQRPDLRQPPPPPFSVPHPPYYTTYAAQPPHPSGIPQNDRVWAMLSHLSVFFLPLWFPLIVWLVTQHSMPYASRQAKQAFFFHVIVSGLMLVVVLPVVVFVNFSMFATLAQGPASNPAIPFPPGYFASFALIWLVTMLIGITNMAFGIYGAVQSYQGKPFHYPLLGRL